jgi:hypothetical protein
MISCTEFICAYNEIFKLLDRDYGFDAVKKLWAGIRENFLIELTNFLEREGISGAYKYWSRTLAEEDAVCDIKFDDAEGRLEIYMKECPSVKRARASAAGYYERYCEHCAELYPSLLEAYGISCEWEIIDTQAGICRWLMKSRCRNNPEEKE